MRSRTLTIFLVVAAATALAGDSGVEKLRREHSGGKYRIPCVRELDAARGLFVRTLRCVEATDALRRKWRALGFRLVEARIGGDRCLFVVEQPARREGRGVFAVRKGRSRPVLIQAPHSFRDLYTGEIVARMFRTTPFVAAAWNTVPRRGKGPKRGKDDERAGKWGEADVAHNPSSFFMEFVKAFAECYRDGTVVQIHGFDYRKRSTPAGRSAGVILSAGTESPEPGELAARRECLGNILGAGVKVYPADVKELGGTLNRQGRWLRENDAGRFVHVELNRETRELLRKEKETCSRVARCLGGF